MEYKKVQSAAKTLLVKGSKQDARILDTMKIVSDIVGATLGPGGCPVLIERFEYGLPPLVTKDGVTVFRSLGFEDAAMHCIMEAARDASVRTATEAGDGTTTATVLAEAIVRLMKEYTKANPKVSPQKICRRLESLFEEDLRPVIDGAAVKCDRSTEEGRNNLRAVAAISANGDSTLADAVMDCYEIVGDEGNVTIVEYNGEKSLYEVEKIKGYPVPLGYEDSCAKYFQKFINDPGTQRCVMENPVFILYHGKLTEMQTIVNLLIKAGTAWGTGEFDHHNIVLVATGFSESVLGQLALNFAEATTINVYPLLAPMSGAAGGNGQLHFLQDLSAITGARIFDPMNAPLEHGELPDLGPGVKQFEAQRTRSNILGHAIGQVIDSAGEPISDPETLEPVLYEDLMFKHIEHLKTQLEQPTSEYDARLLQERVGKVTGGIAKLKVIGSSTGELKEKRDRAEDAVCAVRGAMKHGCLPGGGWMLLKLAMYLELKYPTDPVVTEILIPALHQPVARLLHNAGLVEEEIHGVFDEIDKSFTVSEGLGLLVYDCMKHQYVEPFKGGVLDSTPAVLEAIRNSISIAALLGTLGGTVVFQRDAQFERDEARATQSFLRDSNVNEANERS